MTKILVVLSRQVNAACVRMKNVEVPMKKNSDSQTRRDFVRSATVPLVGAMLFGASTSVASAKGSQAQFKYQSKPNGSKKCSACKFFVKGKTATANGSCTLVDGAISPNGWCIAYQAKTS
jgi:High potential iron-sulfur protein